MSSIRQFLLTENRTICHTTPYTIAVVTVCPLMIIERHKFLHQVLSNHIDADQ